MCVPVATAPANGGVEIDVVELPAGVTASVLHQGSYDDMGESYATVAQWIHQRGHRILGPSREVYLNSPGEVDQADLLTEIHFPIDSEEEHR